MSDATGGQQEPNKPLSREEIVAALDADPAFDFVTSHAGIVHVTPMLANTLERIAIEFEREGTDDEAKLRCLLCQIGRTNGDDGQLIPITDALANDVTGAELDDFARKLLVSEEWTSEGEAAGEPDPKGRVVTELRKQIEAVGASYRKILNALGPSISTGARASIANATRLADKLRMGALARSPALRAIETLQKESSIAKLAASVAQVPKSIAERASYDHAARLKEALPAFATERVPPAISSLPPLINPTAESAKATAESAANMEQALDRLEQRANDSALLIAAIHDMIRDTTLDMARAAQESSAATKQSLDQAAASVAIGAQSLNWAKYALMTSVGIGFVGLIFAGISAWYAVFPTNTVGSPSTVVESIHSPKGMLPTPVDRLDAGELREGASEQRGYRNPNVATDRAAHPSSGARSAMPEVAIGSSG
ncbi:hypothetical protein PQQ52_02355 [Paraburkholderia sediminicola]|uniref:hypothetical protein n=1 Tax=Paraburkholderia sediminicola TaxID=458836 RepID=UPI0038BC5295